VTLPAPGPAADILFHADAALVGLAVLVFGALIRQILR
jgi:hypothetical protein